MKRVLRLLAAVSTVVLVLASSTVSAEEVYRRDQPRTPNLIMFDPGDLLNGVVRFEYERALTTWFGLSIGLAITSFRGAFSATSEESVVAVGPELGVKFHFIQDAPGGLFVGPYVGGSVITSRSSGSNASALAYDLGAQAGYNIILFDHFVLSLGAGGGFHDRGEGLHWAPRFRLGLGGVF